MIQTPIRGIPHDQDLNTVSDDALEALLAEIARHGVPEPGSLKAEKVQEIEAILAARKEKGVFLSDGGMHHPV